MTNVYVLTGYNELEGTTTVLGVYATRDEAHKMMEWCEESADKDNNVYHEFDVDDYPLIQKADPLEIPGDMGDD